MNSDKKTKMFEIILLLIICCFCYIFYKRIKEIFIRYEDYSKTISNKIMNKNHETEMKILTSSIIEWNKEVVKGYNYNEMIEKIKNVCGNITSKLIIPTDVSSYTIININDKKERKLFEFIENTFNNKYELCFYHFDNNTNHINDFFVTSSCFIDTKTIVCFTSLILLNAMNYNRRIQLSIVPQPHQPYKICNLPQGKKYVSVIRSSICDNSYIDVKIHYVNKHCELFLKCYNLQNDINNVWITIL